MSETPPSLDALAANPQAVATLPVEVVPALLAQLAALQTALAARLLTAPKGDAPFGDRCLTADEIAKRLQVPKSHVYDLIRRRLLPSIRVGDKYVRVPLPALEQWLRNSLDGDVYNKYNSNYGTHERRRTAKNSKGPRVDASADGRGNRVDLKQPGQGGTGRDADLGTRGDTGAAPAPGETGA